MGLFRRKKSSEMVDIKALAGSIIHHDREQRQTQSSKSSSSPLRALHMTVEREGVRQVLSSAAVLSNEALPE